jgi:hypothetical protein
LLTRADFQLPPQLPLRPNVIGDGRTLHVPGRFHLVVPPAAAGYHDAQISDYTTPADFCWHPPLRLRIRACFAGLHAGTAGFGFWNHPFVPGERGFRLPRAVWFFASSPPNDMRLALDVPGAGWKAATFDALRLPFFLLLPAALPGLLLMRVPALYRRLWPVGQRALGVSEALLDPALLTDFHEYTLDWLPESVYFAVDGQPVHHARVAVRGPLGFIVWIDNQYAIVTPQGRFAFGVSPALHEQSLTLESVEIEPLLTSLR